MIFLQEFFYNPAECCYFLFLLFVCFIISDFLLYNCTFNLWMDATLVLMTVMTIELMTNVKLFFKIAENLLIWMTYRFGFGFFCSVLTPELVYHRLDLLPTDNMCVHLKQLSTLGKLHLLLWFSFILWCYTCSLY